MLGCEFFVKFFFHLCGYRIIFKLVHDLMIDFILLLFVCHNLMFDSCGFLQSFGSIWVYGCCIFPCVGVKSFLHLLLTVYCLWSDLLDFLNYAFWSYFVFSNQLYDNVFNIGKSSLACDNGIYQRYRNVVPIVSINLIMNKEVRKLHILFIHQLYLKLVPVIDLLADKVGTFSKILYLQISEYLFLQLSATKRFILMKAHKCWSGRRTHTSLVWALWRFPWTHTVLLLNRIWQFRESWLRVLPWTTTFWSC